MKNMIHPIFGSLSEEELEALKMHTRIHEKNIKKNTIIFHFGDLVTETGIVLSGSVHIETTDFWGNTSLLSNVEAGGVFAETYSLCHEPMMVDVAAASDCRILFMDMEFLHDPTLSG